jgi:hypothetical protein
MLSSSLLSKKLSSEEALCCVLLFFMELLSASKLLDCSLKEANELDELLSLRELLSFFELEKLLSAVEEEPCELVAVMDNPQLTPVAVSIAHIVNMASHFDNFINIPLLLF